MMSVRKGIVEGQELMQTLLSEENLRTIAFWNRLSINLTFVLTTYPPKLGLLLLF